MQIKVLERILNLKKPQNTHPTILISNALVKYPLKLSNIFFICNRIYLLLQKVCNNILDLLCNAD
ncbi:hypothetical protein OIU78_008426 [Salix suchowensis]|nr:hypothetical protein OIU78_008426 [Salix suchowensis]